MEIEQYIKSPINYSGSKYRLIRKGLIDLFPKDINVFVDLFCGVCNVGINVDANRIICNDYINYIPELFNCWQDKTIEEINLHIDNRIKEFNLSGDNCDTFLKFREYYNQNKNIEDLFILLCYSFNYQMRFNNNHQYNSSFGKTASTMNDNIRNNINMFVERIKSKNIKFNCGDFRELKTDKLSNEDFVYCDPPYLVSGAIYQDGKRGFKGWCQQDDIDLYNILDELNEKGVKFALSNMIESKGNINTYLKEWSEKYNVINLEMNYGGSNYQRKSSGKDIEVLITNY